MPPLRVLAYVIALSVVGVGSAIGIVAMTPWSAVFSNYSWVVLVIMVAAAVVGEVKPVAFFSGGGEERSLSISAPFILAILALYGLGPAIVAQVIASVTDDALRRPAPVKMLFNTAQYAVSVIVAGLAYSLLSGTDVIHPRPEMAPTHVFALVFAGIAMVVANWMLVAGVVSISTGYGIVGVLREGAKDFAVTNLILLSFGAIAALMADSGLLALSLLITPLVGVHLFAASSAKHAYDAMHDSLTGLGNRGQLQRALSHAVETSGDSTTDGPGLILLDLDHFKDVNDALGHPVGDRILVEVARRLTEAAAENATVHRLGGDEFAVVLDGGLADTKQAAHDLIGCFDKPVTVENLELLVRASVGVAVAPDHGTTGAELMKNADIALYQAKIERDRISTYSKELDVNSVERLQILADLRTALDNREMHLVYQPQIDLDERCIRGVEALIRWEHPERGLVPPDDFVGLAENSGLIFPLTHYVLDSALGQLAQWRRDGHQIRLAVNLSARHLSDLALPDQVWEIAARHGVPLTSLVLEVTETGILSDPVRADVVIRSLRELGVEISIDDYGTGNASLNYLKRLEIDELKIDRSFVSNLLTDDHDRIIVHSTIELALNLGLRVVAEGIEDQETTDMLRHHGGVIGQGFHLGRPLSVDDMTATLEANARGGMGSVSARDLGAKTKASRSGTASKAVS